MGCSSNRPMTSSNLNKPLETNQPEDNPNISNNNKDDTSNKVSSVDPAVGNVYVYHYPQIEQSSKRTPSANEINNNPALLYAEEVKTEYIDLDKYNDVPLKELNQLVMPPKKTSLWKTATDFFWITQYLFVLRKYTLKSKECQILIEKRTNSAVPEIVRLREWIYEIASEYIEVIKGYSSISIIIKTDTKDKGRKLLQLIKKFVNNLPEKHLPKDVTKILYNFIRKDTYYPKDFLLTFQIFRLRFGFYGESKNDTGEQRAMLLSILLLSKILLVLIFFQIEDYLGPLDLEVKRNFIYFGSILHYINVNCFAEKVPKLFNLQNCFNYYRIYRCSNPKIEDQIFNLLNKNIILSDYDEIQNDKEYTPVSKTYLTGYFKDNEELVKEIENSIYNWGINLAKYVKFKYDWTDIA